MAQSTGEIVTHMDETGLNITQSSDSICNHPIAIIHSSIVHIFDENIEKLSPRDNKKQQGDETC